MRDVDSGRTDSMLPYVGIQKEGKFIAQCPYCDQLVYMGTAQMEGANCNCGALLWNGSAYIRKVTG